MCIADECQFKVIHCSNCLSSGLVTGLDQLSMTLCYDCTNTPKNDNKESKKRWEEWQKVKPTSNQYPTVIGDNSTNLPQLFPGDKAVISPVLPIVTVKKNYKSNLQLRQESISLSQNPAETWSNILPRTHLKNRFVIVGRRPATSSTSLPTPLKSDSGCCFCFNIIRNS